MNLRNIFQHLHPFNKLVFLTIISILSLFVSIIIGAIFAIPIFGLSAFLHILNGDTISSPEMIGILKYLQLVQSIGFFVIPSLFAAYFFSENTVGYLKIKVPPRSFCIIISILLVWASSPIINVIGMWNSEMIFPEWLSGIEQWMRSKETEAAEITDKLLETDSIKGLLFNIFLIGVLPAIGEELLFRGVIQRIITNWTGKQHLGIWITAILFSALHLQFFGFLPRLLLGALFGYMLVWTGNLWLPIIAHFVNNATAVLAYYLYDKQIITVDPDQLGTTSSYGWAAIVSLFMVILMGYLLWKRGKNKVSELDNRL